MGPLAHGAILLYNGQPTQQISDVRPCVPRLRGGVMLHLLALPEPIAAARTTP